MTLFGEMARPSDTNWSQVVLTTSVMVLVTAALVPTADSDRGLLRDPLQDEVGHAPREPRARPEPLHDGPGGLESLGRRAVHEKNPRRHALLELEGEHRRREAEPQRRPAQLDPAHGVVEGLHVQHGVRAREAERAVGLLVGGPDEGLEHRRVAPRRRVPRGGGGVRPEPHVILARLTPHTRHHAHEPDHTLAPLPLGQELARDEEELPGPATEVLSSLVDREQLA
eukprot:9477105-Pyramimonas_sp.AAC.1